VATIDLESALVMLRHAAARAGLHVADRPLHRGAHARALARAARLSTHFLDVVRGLPTLRAFNRGEAQAARSRRSASATAAATMGTLRVSFLSGSVLELAATLGVALVAVTVGRAARRRRLGLQAGLTVLVLAPELYLPLRRLGAEYHASADGLAVAERMLRAARRAGRRRRGRPRPRRARRAPVRLERVVVRLSVPAGLVLDGLDLELAPGRDRRAGRRERRRQEHRGGAAARLRADGRRVTVGGVDLADCDRRRVARGRSRGCRSTRRSARHVADNIRLGDPARPTRVRAAAGARRRRRLRRRAAGRLRHARRRRRAGRCRRASAADRPGAGVPARRPLVILDEPTADLDPRAWSSSPRRRAAAAGRTMLLIAHRPELVAHADRIVRLEPVRRACRTGAGGGVTATLGRLLGLADAPRPRASRSPPRSARSRSSSASG
jgi:ATP-binding cassette subfamily C protein CydD